MSYIQANLLAGEQVVYQAKVHWITFAAPAFTLVGAALCFGIGDGVSVIGVLLFIVAFIMGIARFAAYASSEFAVTDKRVLVKVGFFRRHSLELVLHRVEGIGVDQGVLGRMFNYGTIMVTGTGGTKEPFRNIARPLEFRRQVQQRITTG